MSRVGEPMQWRCHCTGSHMRGYPKVSCTWAGYRADGPWAEHRFAHQRAHPKPCPICGNHTVIGSFVRWDKPRGF